MSSNNICVYKVNFPQKISQLLSQTLYRMGVVFVSDHFIMAFKNEIVALEYTLCQYEPL